MAQLISSNKRVVCPFVGLIRNKPCLVLNLSYLFPFAGDETSSCSQHREEAGAGLSSPQLQNHGEMGILCWCSLGFSEDNSDHGMRQSLGVSAAPTTSPASSLSWA